MDALADCKISLASLVMIAAGDDLLRVNFIYVVYEMWNLKFMLTSQSVDEFKKRSKKAFIEKISILIARNLIVVAEIIV